MTSKILNNVISSRSEGDIAKLFWTCLFCPSIFLAKVLFLLLFSTSLPAQSPGVLFLVCVVWLFCCCCFCWDFVCVLPPPFAFWFFWYCMVDVVFGLFTCVVQISHKFAMQSS